MSDYDKDGIEDDLDVPANGYKGPTTFDKTKSNKGKRVPITQEQPSFAPRINPISIPGFAAVSPDEAKSWFRYSGQNDPASRNEILNNMVKLGLIKSVKDTATANKIWDAGVNWTQSLGANSGKVLDYLPIANPADWADENGQYGTTSYKQTQVTKYTPSNAANDIQQMFKQEMGREATAQEVNSYNALINSAAKKEPSVQQGTTTTSPSGSVSSGTSTTAFNPTEFARNFARSQPDYAENFAAKEFVSLIDSALSDPNRIGQVVQ